VIASNLPGNPNGEPVTVLSVPFEALIAYPLTGVGVPEYPLPPVYTNVPRFWALAQIAPAAHKANNINQIFANRKEGGN
jgi:hypothetical protein